MPEWEMVFRFTPGRLCLSFCATVGERWRRSFERVRTPDDLARWVHQAGLGADPVPVSEAELDDARVLREAVYRMVRAGMKGERGTESDRDVINTAARGRTVSAQISPDHTRTPWPGDAPATAALATVALDAVDLLTGAEIWHVRECSATDCALLFLDMSRPGRRRWCADGACGTKARSAAYRARRGSFT